MQTSGRTQVLGIIGDPVVHSLSPALHNAAFRALGLDYAYVAFPCRPSQLRAAVAGIRALGVVGVNVTVPHKERVVRMLDSISRAAERVGAVNTIINRGGRLHGENTDVIGVVRALRDARVAIRGARVLVVGAGGAARAVLTAMDEWHAASVIIVNRTPRRAKALVRRVASARLSADGRGLDGLQDRELLASVDLVVNTTSVGLHGEAFPPVAYAASPRHCVYFDLVYGRQTDFLTSAARVRRRTLDGLGMLLHQGAASFTLWTGRSAPIGAMRAALRSARRLTPNPN